MGIALQLVTDLPNTATVERHKDRRQKKVYVDVLQNAPRSPCRTAVRVAGRLAGNSFNAANLVRADARTRSTALQSQDHFPAAGPTKERSNGAARCLINARSLRPAGVHIPLPLLSPSERPRGCAFSRQTRSAVQQRSPARLQDRGAGPQPSPSETVPPCSADP